MSGAMRGTDAEFPGSPAANWFSNLLFGACYKAPAQDGELNLGDKPCKEKKAKKSKKREKNAAVAASGESPRSCTADGFGKIGTSVSSGGARFRIDNTALQIKKRPGVAFRRSKTESDKVGSELGSAKWDEIVEGHDEGDGWLKVGEYYLPMMYKGVPIITPVVDSESPQKVTITSRAPTTPLSPNSSVGQKSTTGSPAAKKVPEQSTPAGKSSPDSGDSKKLEPTILTKTGPEQGTLVCMPDVGVGSPARSASPVDATADGIVMESNANSAVAGVIDEQQKSPKLTELVDCPSSTTDVGVCNELNELCSGDDIEKPAKEYAEMTAQVAEKAEAEPEALHQATAGGSRIWLKQPSVGTWLQALPQAMEEDSPPAEDSPCKRSSPEVKWHHQPSVGTWLQMAPGRGSGLKVSAGCVKSEA